jgi:hypothetical protein
VILNSLVQSVFAKHNSHTNFFQHEHRGLLRTSESQMNATLRVWNLSVDLVVDAVVLVTPMRLVVCSSQVAVQLPLNSSSCLY